MRQQAEQWPNRAGGPEGVGGWRAGVQARLFHFRQQLALHVSGGLAELPQLGPGLDQLAFPLQREGLPIRPAGRSARGHKRMQKRGRGGRAQKKKEPSSQVSQHVQPLLPTPHFG